MKQILSLCMIVKNEEKVIERCLSSVGSLIDEIIIVDTGSTDRTKELASKYTTKIYDFEWINDFSAARNYAASKASGEWILVLDADEYVDEENLKSFIDDLKGNRENVDAFSAKIINFTGNFGENLLQNYHDRIYKNNGEISYYRQIHEQFKNNNDKPINIKHSRLVIFHSGYLNQTVSEKDKNSRNKNLLDQEMKNGPINAFDYFNYGNEYCSIGEYSKALEAYLEAYKQKVDFNLSWVSTTLIQIVICLINLKRYNDALNVIEDAENIYDNSPEFPYLKGEIFFLRGQLEDAKTVFLQLTNNGENYNHIIFRPDLKDQRPHLRLGEIFLQQQNFSGAIFHYTSVLNINNNHKESISKVIYILNKFHTVEEITDFLYSNNLLGANNINDYVRACFEAGNPALASRLIDNDSVEHKLLNKLAILKDIVINNRGNINNVSEVFELDLFRSLINSNWINIVDLLLLSNFKNECEKLTIALKPYEENNEYNALLKLMNGETWDETIDESLIQLLVQNLILYKKHDNCSSVLNNINHLKGKVISKIAAILYSNGFKVEALQLYDKSDWNYFDEQDFINIINSLIETKNIDSAIEIAKYAIMTYETDFRFYKYILEHSRDLSLVKSTYKNANEVFMVSRYLKEFMI
ncbi:glycosyltransferase family 2 protein [Bacillus sp. FJAT-49736]|uniref:tetratricopeptide repeat-containing glycosyltransferase family 2 protein n=1 Tax=Bacillus sp. FJAT-49736 TaxID=2833582 RepID=UPI001BC9EF00|nr:glycosyltransferase family 2 protein [Bacillus sp. FJAT-49736]MBS4174158.1 glycosyltransferase family 2 protein [Bacillus sp. FJAT-49736]